MSGLLDSRMGTVTRSTNNVSIRLNGDNDKRDITDLWAEALSEYDGIVGFDLKPTFVNVESMIANGEKAMNDFHRFRHDQKKVDKLRSIFSSNMSLIEKGAKQLVEAATPAFPPAAAIGTALTFVLSVRKVSLQQTQLTLFMSGLQKGICRLRCSHCFLRRHEQFPTTSHHPCEKITAERCLAEGSPKCVYILSEDVWLCAQIY